MVRIALSLVAAFLLLSRLHGGEVELELEVVPPDRDLVGREADLPEAQRKALAGRGDPARSAPATAVVVEWDDYTSVLIVEPGEGLLRHARVLTQEKPDARAPIRVPPGSEYLVSYRGRAFVDADGNLQLDCRGASLVGPAANKWFPDSFKISDAGKVSTCDDQPVTGTGVVVRRVERDEDREAYGQLRTYVEMLAAGVY